MVTVGELAKRFDGEVRGDTNVEIHGVASLSSAGPQDISYLASKRYHAALAVTAAGAVILARENAGRFSGTCVIVDNPRLCFARAAALLNPRVQFKPGVHPTAVVNQAATVAATASIGAYSVIEEQAVVEDHVFVGAGCYLGPRTRIGRSSTLVAQVVVSHDCAIGEQCIVHPGVVIGSEGFGYVSDGERWIKIPQLGRVRIGNEVEIGANTTIDRGALDDTIIADGVKLDNLTQIAHNVRIGEHTAMAAQVGIAGSTRVGERCTIGGQAGIIDNLEIADRVHITAGSLVTSSIKEAGAYSSSLKAQPAGKWRRTAGRLSQLDEMAKRLQILEQEIERLSGARKA
jgi:UDP-3-O-[3-hydroxymyristoyl] glucosamine N-acyltransferase